MSRSVADTPWDYRDARIAYENHECSTILGCNCIDYVGGGAPGESAHELTDLRYSRAEVAAAQAEGRRPVPTPTTVSIDKHAAWSWGDEQTRSTARTRKAHYGSTRTRLSNERHHALQVANAAARAHDGADEQAPWWEDLYVDDIEDGLVAAPVPVSKGHYVF